MICQFFDREDETNPFNGMSIKDEATLRHIIEKCTSRPPFFCELVGGNEYDLLIGIGPSLGLAQYSRHDGEMPYLITVKNNPSLEDNTEFLEFLIGGTPTPVRLRQCLPMDQIIDAACYFQATGARSSRVAWEEV